MHGVKILHVPLFFLVQSPYGAYTIHGHTFGHNIHHIMQHLQGLIRAMERDGPIGNNWQHAINACLVIAGVRTAARLEYYVRDIRHSHFIRSLQRLGAKTNTRVVFFGFGNSEPLLVDLNRANQSDLKILQESQNRSDLEEPLLGAMGRLLQYQCPYPGGEFHANPGMSLNVQIQNIDSGALESRWLAGFGCKSRLLKRAVTSAIHTWIIPACASNLIGCVFTMKNTKYVIVGFNVDVNEADV
jgi:hypothetical protein